TPLGLTIPTVTLPSLPTGSFGTAAALGYTDFDSTTRAYLSSNASTTGALTVNAAGDSDVQTTANGSTVDGTLVNKEIGAAAAFNLADSVTEAYLSGSPSITAPGGVTVQAIMNHDTGDNVPDGVNTTGATATSGDGASGV